MSLSHFTVTAELFPFLDERRSGASGALLSEEMKARLRRTQGTCTDKART